MSTKLKADELKGARAVVMAYEVCVQDMKLCLEWCQKNYPEQAVNSLELGIFYMTRRQAYWKDRIENTTNPKMEN